MPLDRNDSRVTGWPSRWGCTRYSPLVAGARSALEASGLCKERHYPSIQCTGGGILGTIAPLTGAVRAAKQWTASGPKLSLASTDMLQELGHLAGQKAGCVWEGDNRPGWHPACLPRYRKAWRPHLAPIHSAQAFGDLASTLPLRPQPGHFQPHPTWGQGRGWGAILGLQRELWWAWKRQ